MALGTSLFDEWQRNSLQGQTLGGTVGGLANPAASLLAGGSAYGSLTAPPVDAFRTLAPKLTAAFDPLGTNALSPASSAIGSAIGGFGGPPQAAMGRLSDALAPPPSPSASDALSSFGARAADTLAQSPFGARASDTMPGADNPYGLDRTQFGAENPMGRFYNQALDNMQKLAQQWGWNTPGQTGSALTGGATGAVGNVGTGVGQFDAGADADIATAAGKYGVPANFLKAIVNNESSGDWADNSHWVNSVRGGARIYGYVGVFEDAAQSWGFNFDSLNGNRLGQLEMLASGLRGMYDRSPGHNWDQVASMHFSGNWTPSGYTDELGNNDADYVNKALNTWHQLDASVGQQTSTQTAPGAGQLGGMGPDPTNTANAVLEQAKKYVGVPYVWGSVPGKGQDPRTTGWDCSGFTYWLDQNYGTGQLPMGSHYQYQDAAAKGKLFTNTGQLQPGDLLFFDTGPDNGGGAELNRAGHVAVYLGNGQIIQAANPSQGTIISDFSGYYSQTFIGAEHMSWSSQSSAAYGGSVGSYQQPANGGQWWLNLYH